MLAAERESIRGYGDRASTVFTRCRLKAGSSMATSHGSWPFRPSILAFCFAPVLGIAVTGAFVTAASDVLLAQALLSVSTFLSLRLLRHRQLLDPIQAIPLYFHWYFAVGPCVHGLYALATGTASHSVYSRFTGQTLGDSYYLIHGSTALFIVAGGQVLYSAGSCAVFRFWPIEWYAKFLAPSGVQYLPRTFITWWIIAGGTLAITAGLSLVGVRAFDTINYFGGRITNNPLEAAAYSLTCLGELATVGAIGYFFIRRQAGTRWTRFAAAALAAALTLQGVFSGSKGPIVQYAYYAVVIYITWHGRVPWRWVLGLLAIYLMLIEPFVESARLAAETIQAHTTAAGRDVFLEALKDIPLKQKALSDLNVESPFRFIYYCASETADRATMTGGPFGGQTLIDGLSSLVPRFLYPAKSDANMGNVFARAIGIAPQTDRQTNAGITVPFEFVGNFGFAAGLASFYAIGVIWTSLMLYILGKGRMALHPLSPYFVGVALHIEASAGQFIGAYKDLGIAFGALWLLWAIRGKRGL